MVPCGKLGPSHGLPPLSRLCLARGGFLTPLPPSAPSRPHVRPPPPQEQERSEKASRRAGTVSEVRSHVAALREMLGAHRRPGPAPPDQGALQVAARAGGGGQGPHAWGAWSWASTRVRPRAVTTIGRLHGPWRPSLASRSPGSRPAARSHSSAFPRLVPVQHGGSHPLQPPAAPAPPPRRQCQPRRQPSPPAVLLVWPVLRVPARPSATHAVSGEASAHVTGPFFVGSSP